jgi:hypothetical protein
MGEFEHVTLERRSDVIATVPRDDMGQSGQDPGERGLSEGLHMAAVYESASAWADGVISVNRSLVEGASGERRCEIDVVPEWVDAGFARRPIGGWQTGEIPSGHRTDELVERRWVRWSRNLVVVACAASAGRDESTTFVLDRGPPLR